MNQVGIQQVQQAALHLPTKWDIVLSSPLERARHTAEFSLSESVPKR